MSKKKMAYGLRTVDKDCKGYNGFQWPKTGHVVAPDWEPTKDCGHGLHALLNGEGESGYLLGVFTNTERLWQVVRFDLNRAIDIRGKYKFPECDVLYTGTVEKATRMLLKKVPMARIHYLVSKVGDGTHIRAGNHARLTAGNGCSIHAYQGATVTCGNGCKVELFSGQVTTGDNCHVILRTDGAASTIRVGNNCQVEVSGSWGNANVYAGNGCTLALAVRNHSILHTGDDCHITLERGKLKCGKNCHIDVLGWDERVGEKIQSYKDFGGDPTSNMGLVYMPGVTYQVLVGSLKPCRTA